jgi:hypothetical protein
VSINGQKAATMKNYNALKTVMASVNPSSTASSAYTPSNTPAACPKLSSVWAASDNLPPAPDSSLCSCMYDTLSCVPNDGLDSKKFGDIFGFICGAVPSACSGINTNTTTGVYGTYSMCTDKQKLGYVLDAYYKSQKSSASACDFKGQAVLNKSPSAASSCSAALSSASAANSVAATATTAPKGSSTSTNIAMPLSVKALFSVGDLAVGLYVLVAMGVGATMIVL